MDYIITRDTQETSIRLIGPFTFSDTLKFKGMIHQLMDKQSHGISIDFSNVTFIDSAGLGMLLLLRSECANRQIALAIHSASGQVERLFMISKFDQLFSLRTGNA